MFPSLENVIKVSIVLYCIALRCIVLHCIVLYCILLYVTFQKRVRVFHRVSKLEKHLKPRGRRPSGFIVFERLETWWNARTRFWNITWRVRQALKRNKHDWLLRIPAENTLPLKAEMLKFLALPSLCKTLCGSPNSCPAVRVVKNCGKTRRGMARPWENSNIYVGKVVMLPELFFFSQSLPGPPLKQNQQTVSTHIWFVCPPFHPISELINVARCFKFNP